MSLSMEALRRPEFLLPKQVNCNLCGGKGLRAFDPSSGLPLIQCETCLLVSVFRLPKIELLEKIYGEGYFRSESSDSLGYSNYVVDEANIRRTFDRRLAEIEKYMKPGKVLDVGCAVGFFLAEAKRRGWAPQGLDISKYAVEHAKTKLGLSAQVGTLAHAKFEPGSFDLVTHWDSIEHVTDPMGSLAKTSELLRPGGLCVLTTPDIGSAPAKIMGKNWIGLKSSHEHLYYFSSETMAQMLRVAGLEVVETSHVGKYVSLNFFFDRLQSYSRILGKGGSLVEKMFGLGEIPLYVNSMDIVFIIARKK